MRGSWRKFFPYCAFYYDKYQYSKEQTINTAFDTSAKEGKRVLLYFNMKWQKLMETNVQSFVGYLVGIYREQCYALCQFEDITKSYGNTLPFLMLCYTESPSRACILLPKWSPNGLIFSVENPRGINCLLSPDNHRQSIFSSSHSTVDRIYPLCWS